MKVAFYDRHQLLNGEVPQLHTEDAERIIQRLKDSPVNEYIGSFIDNCKDRIEPMEREEFRQLYEKCKNGEIDQIVIMSVSRLSRSTVTLIKTCKELSEMGTEVMFIKEEVSGDMLLKSETINKLHNTEEMPGLSLGM